MKKLIVIALSVMMLFSFTACNNSTPADLEIGIVADYFGAFATNHIFNQVDLELGENTDSDEISGLTTTYTPAAEASAGVEAQPAKITATFTADNLRFNGKSDNADKNQRFANGTVTVTIEGTVEDTTFTGTKMTFSGTDLSLSDNPDNYTTETAKNQLPNITTDVEITAPFAEDGVALGGFFETYYTSLGDGDTTFFYYPEESGADELGSCSTRYLFINTPEIDHGPSSSIVEEPWGQAAKKYNNDILKNAKHIIIQSARHSALHETYGRYLGCVWYTNEENPTLDDYILLNYQIAYNGYSEQANSGSYNEMISNDMYYSYYFEVAFNRARDLGLKVFGEIDPDFDY